MRRKVLGGAQTRTKRTNTTMRRTLGGELRSCCCSIQATSKEQGNRMSALLGGQGECWRKSCSETEGAKERGGEGWQRPWQGPTQFEGAFKRSCCSTHPEKVPDRGR